VEIVSQRPVIVIVDKLEHPPNAVGAMEPTGPSIVIEDNIEQPEKAYSSI